MYVVVTHYQTLSGTVVVHAYGPYTLGKANQTKQKIAARNDGNERLHISICKVIKLDEV